MLDLLTTYLTLYVHARTINIKSVNCPVNISYESGKAPAQRQTSPDRPQLGDEVRDYKRLMTGDNIIEIEKYTRCLSNEQRESCEINSFLSKFIILGKFSIRLGRN
ncbi:hypothetical protein Zmor_021018 [Zophobas morio]|uniref:Uncharacterized protein n=1 Tax=Zophobas morio TaxID=2755281 RepID=A0AA38MA77_9CUCU|nr:hypothetical protein Zmor_021018 [Zophobas morio]